MSSITSDRKTNKIKLWAVAVWLGVWQLASMWIGQEILIVSPATVFCRLLELLPEAEFWSSIFSTVSRIAAGFLLAALSGGAAAAAAAAHGWLEELLRPFVLTIKAIPVASFIILVLIWIPSKNLSIVISFLMVFPVVYTNVLEGEKERDKKLLEMAQVFELPWTVRIRYVDLPQLLPYIRTACTLSLGLCWKAGVAAEVIGIPQNSVGEKLYNAKIYLDTPDLFAWTVVIICLSFCFEKVFLALIQKGMRCLERME